MLRRFSASCLNPSLLSDLITSITVMPRSLIASLMSATSRGMKPRVSSEPDAMATLAFMSSLGLARPRSSNTADTASMARRRGSKACSSVNGVNPPSASKSRCRTR